MTEYVNKTRSGLSGNRYHTDPNCRYLNRRREVTPGEIENKNLQLCKECAGIPRDTSQQDHSVYELARSIGEQE